MPEAIFTGTQTLTYLGFFDAVTGRTLACDPGGTYDILPDIPPDGRFIPVEPGDPDGDPEPENPEEPAGQADPEPEE